MRLPVTRRSVLLPWSKELSARFAPRTFMALIQTVSLIRRCRTKFRTAVVVAACLGLGCDQTVGPEVLATSARPSQTRSTPSDQSQRDPITLAFDLPSDFAARAADGTPVISGFQVGYFRPGALKNPLKTVDFPRDAVVIDRETVRVTFPLESLPEGDNTVVLRMRTVSRGQLGDWSEPTGVITVPPLMPASGKRASSGSRGKKQRPGLAAADLDGHPALKDALQPLLTPGFDVNAALRPFRRVEDLATAVALSRQHKLPFVDLCKSLEGPPPRSLREALRALQPSLRVGSAVRRARDESRALLNRSRQRQ